MNARSAPTLADEILSYFVRHPQATDDLEGIARWKLLNELVSRRVAETGTALAWLVEQGYLRETKIHGGRVIYGLNPEKLEQARELLAARVSEGEG